jgi:ATP-dependent RNA helicase RhlE
LIVPADTHTITQANRGCTRASDSATRSLHTNQNQSFGFAAQPESNGSEHGVFLSFCDLSLSPVTLESVRQRGHFHPTPIQSAAIPIALSGRDLIATAETGSGKTAAYLLPILNRLHDDKVSRLGALVLAPTRELASQIGEEFRMLARNTRMRVAVVVGGESMDRQLRELRRGVEVLVACPGRLVDHLERGTVKLDRIEVVVIDEADRMLDMGFLPQLRRVLRMVKKPRQTLMFSATMDTEVERIGREFLSDPARVRVGDTAAPPRAIRQTIYAVTQENKPPMLLHLLGQKEVNSAIVFTRTKSRADRVAKLLVRNQFKAIAIHGGRSQSQRNAALAGFRSGHYAVLVATDVAARGLDIPDVSHVINFDLPEAADSYLHRIGRTARMGKAGAALSLVMPEDGFSLRGIERMLGVKLDRAKIGGFETPDLHSNKPETIARQPIARQPHPAAWRRNNGPLSGKARIPSARR